MPTQPAAASGPFKFAIDHCFAIRGQGTVLTGTVLSGKAAVGDVLELPELKVLTAFLLWKVHVTVLSGKAAAGAVLELPELKVLTASLRWNVHRQ